MLLGGDAKALAVVVAVDVVATGGVSIVEMPVVGLAVVVVVPSVVFGAASGDEGGAASAPFALTAEVSFRDIAKATAAMTPRSSSPRTTTTSGHRDGAAVRTPPLGCVGKANGGPAGGPEGPLVKIVAEVTGGVLAGTTGPLEYSPCPDGPLMTVIGTVAPPGSCEANPAATVAGAGRLRTSSGMGLSIASRIPVCAPGPPRSTRIASRISRAFANRSAGSLCVARSITAWTAAGTHGARRDTGSARPSTIAIKRSRSVSASAKGSFPERS